MKGSVMSKEDSNKEKLCLKCRKKLVISDV